MLETKSRDIDGLTFSVRQLPAMRALRTLNRLTRALGPALGHAFEALKDTKSDEFPAHLGGAFEKLAGSLSDDELEALSKELLEGATITKEGKTGELLPVLNLVLAGRCLTLLKVLAFAVEANYSDFFDGLKGLADRVLPQETTPTAGSRA